MKNVTSFPNLFLWGLGNHIMNGALFLFALWMQPLLSEGEQEDAGEHTKMPRKLFFMRGAHFVHLMLSTPFNAAHSQVYQAVTHVQHGARKCYSVLWTLLMQHLGPESWPFHMPSSKYTKANGWYSCLFQSYLDLLCIYSLGGWALGCILLVLSAISNAYVFAVCYSLSVCRCTNMKNGKLIVPTSQLYWLS